MRNTYKILVFALLAGGIIFARGVKSNSRVEGTKVKSGQHYWVKDQSENNDQNKLDRKRSHKRRRKVRKPVKGLR